MTWVSSTPALLKQMTSNFHLRNLSGSFFDSGDQFLKAQLPRRPLEPNPTFYSSRHCWRSWLPTADIIILGLILANAVVFILWRIADPTFMRKHFMLKSSFTGSLQYSLYFNLSFLLAQTISVKNFTDGRVHTLITSAFSHNDLGHLFLNMFRLYIFGQTIGKLLGPVYLLKLYLDGAVTGSIFFLVHHAFMTPKDWSVDPETVSGLGVNGAVNAIMLFYIFLFPFKFPRFRCYVNFMIPVPAMLWGAVLLGEDIKKTTEDSKISGSAELGGVVVAALARIRK